jgi:hypothetical protein
VILLPSEHSAKAKLHVEKKKKKKSSIVSFIFLQYNLLLTSYLKSVKLIYLINILIFFFTCGFKLSLNKIVICFDIKVK